jgi:hypothetical protein
MSSGSPFRRSVSGEEYVEEHDAVVWVRRDFCERVTEREALVGRLRTVSRLPQYLGASQDSLLLEPWLPGVHMVWRGTKIQRTL